MKTQSKGSKGVRKIVALHRAILGTDGNSQFTKGHQKMKMKSRSTDHATRLAVLTLLTFLTHLTLFTTHAATITGTLRDISMGALETKVKFAPTNTVLVTGSGLSAGPPKVIDTVNGAFSIVLEAGDYTVSLPLIPWRQPFGISVMATNGTLNITNVMNAPVTYTYTNKLSIEVRDSTNMLAAVFNQSVNTLSLPHLQKALNDPAHKLKLLWLGDSTGGDSIAAMQLLLNSNYVYGTEPIVMNGGPSGYFDLPSGCGQGLMDSAWWSTSFALTNGTTQTFGGSGGGTFAKANRLAFWYLAKSTRGTAQLQTGPDNATWTTVATVDTSAGAAGLRVTNISLAAGSYNVRVTATSGGAENRVVYLWPELENAGTNSALLFDGHANGQVLGNFLAMGTNNLASLLTNFSPDVIFYEQSKPVYSLTNWPVVAWLFRAYASSADVVLIQSQCAADPTVNADPENGGAYQMAVNRAMAISNSWAFVDNYTPLSDWTNVIVANGFNADDTIHLNATGQLYSGYCLIRQLGLVEQLASAGVLRAVANPLSTINPLYNTTNIGPFTVQSSNGNFAVFDSVGSTAQGLWLGPLSGTAGPWLLAGERNGTSHVRGDNGIYFHTTSGSQPLAGYVWPSGGWSFMDEWYDGLRTVDPGAGNIIVGGTVRAGSGMTTAGTVNATNGFLIGAVKVVSGSGSPESAVTAPVGSLYFRTDGGGGTTLYVKESGSGNTGWTPK